MADNYLERKMEELRSPTKRLMQRRKRAPKGTVYVADITSDSLDEIRARIREGYKVCFTGGDPRESARLARTIGATYLPPKLFYVAAQKFITE